MKRHTRLYIIGSSVVVIIILLAGFIYLKYINSSAGKYEKHLDNANPPADALNNPSTKPIHFSDEELQTLSSTGSGVESLCQDIGLEGNGFDQATFSSFEEIMTKQPNLPDDCLGSVMERLGFQVFIESHRQETSKKYEADDALAIALLRKHPQAAGRVLRDKYSLGTSKADPVVIPILLAVRLPSECSDIAKSASGEVGDRSRYIGVFSEAYNKLCR